MVPKVRFFLNLLEESMMRKRLSITAMPKPLIKVLKWIGVRQRGVMVAVANHLDEEKRRNIF